MRGATPLLLGLAALATHSEIAAAGTGSTQPPAVIIIAVDTLRADRLSSHGYGRRTSPEMDALLARGANLMEARTTEPLTAPAMATVFTGLEPHEHGATRNGLLMEEGLDSLPKRLSAAGWTTAAFVSNWTLRNRLSGLGRHFDDYHEVFTRKRWFGLFNREATAADVTDGALEWLQDHRQRAPATPFLLWVHYVEPHAPYRWHEDFARQLGLPPGKPGRADRYDSEVAAVDAEIGRLVDGVDGAFSDQPPLMVFLADHGESLGEHGEWGHGRQLYEPHLRVPLGFVWEGRIPPARLAGPARLIDIPTTIARLTGIEGPPGGGLDLSGQLLGGADLEVERPLCFQAHKGAVHSDRDSDRARSRGLLSVAVLVDDRKEILNLRRNRLEVYDVGSDPAELDDLAGGDTRPSEALLECVGEITTALGRLDRLAARSLDPETVDQLRALGYLE